MQNSTNWSDLINDICGCIQKDQKAALEAMQVGHKQIQFLDPEVICLDQAEFHDLNQLVWSASERFFETCKTKGIRIQLQLDMRIPKVPMLIQPIQDSLIAALELCLDGTACELRIRTRATGNRVIATLERHCGTTDGRMGLKQATNKKNPPWLDTQLGGHLELLVGECATRALGGKLRLQRRDEDVRLWLELPSTNRPQPSRLVDEFSFLPQIFMEKTLHCPSGHYSTPLS